MIVVFVGEVRKQVAQRAVGDHEILGRAILLHFQGQFYSYHRLLNADQVEFIRCPPPLEVE